MLSFLNDFCIEDLNSSNQYEYPSYLEDDLFSSIIKQTSEGSERQKSIQENSCPDQIDCLYKNLVNDQEEDNKSHSNQYNLETPKRKVKISKKSKAIKKLKSSSETDRSLKKNQINSQKSTLHKLSQCKILKTLIGEMEQIIDLTKQVLFKELLLMNQRLMDQQN